MIKDYLTFLILPGLLGLAVVYAVQEGILALAWALTLGLLGLAVVCLAAIAADLALGLFSLLALGVRKLARVGMRRAWETTDMKRLLALPVTDFLIYAAGTDAQADAPPCWTIPFWQNAQSKLGVPDAFSDEFREQYKREMSRLKKTCASGTDPPPGVDLDCMKAITLSHYQMAIIVKNLPSEAGEKATEAAIRKHDALHKAAEEAGYTIGKGCLTTPPPGVRD